jgi:hypothetical protein
MTGTEEVVVNLNDKMHVKLTQRGENILLNYTFPRGVTVSLSQCSSYLDLYRSKKYDGYYQFQIWEFMEIFGGRIGVSSSPSCSMKVYMEVKE